MCGRDGIRMTFLCYAKCSTCQKAKKWLDDNGIKYTKRPMMIGDDFVLVGFKEAAWEGKLK